MWKWAKHVALAVLLYHFLPYKKNISWRTEEYSTIEIYLWQCKNLNYDTLTY